MSKFRGNNLSFETFGSSHAEKLSIVVRGLPAGEIIDLAELQSFMARRAPGQSELTTARIEKDEVHFISGLDGNALNGKPLCTEILNENVRSSDYVNLKHIPRPGHADFAAWQKFGLEHNMAGGGEFSGRMTALTCVLGGIALQILGRRGIKISTECDVRAEEILAAKAEGDSIGGHIFCRIEGVPAGLGGAGTEGLESLIASLIFGIPAVKEISFGSTKMRGSENNDAFIIRDGKVVTATNNHGGILGGISTGMPIEFTVTVKPTPSISKEQKSVDLDQMEPVTITVHGRHDPCIIPRAMPVVEACAAIALLDVMLTDWDNGSLADMRRQIDNIDAEIHELLDKRMGISSEIADYKEMHSLPTLDSMREQEILDRYPEYADVFREIMRLSRQKQEEKRNG